MNHSKDRLDHPDREFLSLARQQSPRALELIWNAYRSRLVIGLRRKFGAYISYEDCEDLATAAILEVFERSAQFDPARATLATWLMTLAHYHALQFVRKHSCDYLPADERPELAAAELRLVEQAVCEVPSEMMRQALTGLPRVWAEAIRRYYYDGKSIPVIATEMEVAESTVRCYLARGVAKLGTILSMAAQESEAEE